MANSEASWIESHYELANLLYWEPNHIGKKRHPGARIKTAQDAQSHLRKIEVILNQQIKQFLSLAPRSIRNRLCDAAFEDGKHFSGEFFMAGSSREIDAEYGLDDAVQPDFLFLSEGTSVSLEMKISAKSSVEQVLKYALLALAVERKQGRDMEHYLAFLGARGFSGLWEKDCFGSVAELRAELNSRQEAFLTKAGRSNGLCNLRIRYAEIVSSMSIGFIDYDQLARLLKAEAASLDAGPGAQVYRNLITGMLADLTIRGLAK